MNLKASKKYSECLNDLMDYFILTDVKGLSQFKADNSLSDDLLDEFTTNDSGDEVIDQGVMIGLRGIENYPYFVYFNKASNSVFSQLKSDLQHRVKGYALEVSSARIHLLTMPLLKCWSNTIKNSISSRPYFELENGWYSVEVLCGETLQDSGWEPTIEFILVPQDIKPVNKGDVNYSFSVISREY